MADTLQNPPENKEGGDAATAIKDAKEKVDKDVLMGYNLLAQGKRNILCGEVPQAVNQLQEACRLLTAKFGETGNELGEAYLSYGKALLDLSRMESGVLGNALEGIDEDEESGTASSDDKVEDPEDTTGEEREKITDQVIDAMTEERIAEKKEAEKKNLEEKSVEMGNGNNKAGDVKTNSGAGDCTTSNPETKDKKSEGPAGDAKVETKADETPSDKESKENAKNNETKSEKPDSEAPKVNGEVPKVNGVAESAKINGEGKMNGDAKEEDMETEGEKDKDNESEEKDGETEEDEEAESEDIGDEEAESKSQEGEESKTEPDEDISNLQLAWEMLELAKVIYSRQKDKDPQLKAAEAYLKLGEVGMETEQYDQAVEDLKKCLEIQKEYLDPESRLIAETYYQIGLACCFSGKYDDSISNLKNAVNVIESKLAKLKKVVEESETGKGKEPAAFDDPVSIARKEIKDLEEILPDILAKIEDTEDEKKNQDKVKQMVKENVASDLVGTTTVGFGESSSSASVTPAASTSKKVSAIDISHLVRKKRKPEDEPEGEESKKARHETEVLGNKDEAAKESSTADKTVKEDIKSEAMKSAVEKESKASENGDIAQNKGTESTAKTVESPSDKAEEKMETAA